MYMYAFFVQERKRKLGKQCIYQLSFSLPLNMFKNCRNTLCTLVHMTYDHLFNHVTRK